MMDYHYFNCFLNPSFGSTHFLLFHTNFNAYSYFIPFYFITYDITNDALLDAPAAQ